MFISRKQYLKLFYEIDLLLQDLDYDNISNKSLGDIFKLPMDIGKYIRDNYPNTEVVHRIIFEHYKDMNVIWENSKGDRFRLTFKGDEYHTKKRWKEFKELMHINSNKKSK